MPPTPEIEGYSDLVEVARGGFSVVYRAVQDRHDRVVAVKVLQVGALDSSSRARFERECRAMGRLSWHPNVVVLHDSGIAGDGSPYLVMEFLDAGSLGDRLASGPLDWREAVAAGVQVAGALDAAHAAGALHRDVKPANLMIGPYGDVRLGDFGIASLEGSARTTGSHTSFTVDHVSPEVLRGQAPDPRSDVYGLASTVHTLVAGRPPFASDGDEAIAARMLRVLDADVPRLDVGPPALAEVLAAAMAKDPDRRPDTAADLGRRLQDVQSSAGVPVTDLRLAPVGGGGRPARDTAPPETAPPDTAGRDRAPADPSPTRSLRRPPAGDPTPTVRAPRSAPPADDDGEALPAGTPTRGPDPCSTTPPATPDRRWNVWAPVLALTGVAAVLSWVGVWFTDSSPCCSGFSRGDFERLPDLALLGVVLAAVGVALTALRREVPWWGRLGVAVITLLVVAAWLHVLWEFDDRVLPFYEPDDGEAIGWGAWVSALIPLTAAPGLVLLALDVRRPRSPR